MVARAMRDRGTSVPQLATQLGVAEAAVRAIQERLAGPTGARADQSGQSPVGKEEAASFGSHSHTP